MKKILLNAISIKEGGGAVIFIKIVNEMFKQTNQIHWVIVIDEMMRNQINTNDQVTILTYPWIKKSPLHLLYWNEVVLPNLIKELEIDCVFSQTNTLPFRKLSCPTFLSILHAGYFSKEFALLQAQYNSSLRSKIGWWIRKQWVYSSLKKADKIISPTKALGDEIISKLKINKNKITVIWPGAGLADGSVFSKKNEYQQTWRIGYITKYGVQKNFDVLFRAASRLKKHSVRFKLILTLNENHAPFRFVRELINKYNIGDIIENQGESNEEKIRDLYLTLDLFVFPSLCESIGFTLIEAMYYGIPILAANINSNRELLGKNGVFFDPYNNQELFDKIMSIMNNKNYYLSLSRYSINRVKLFSWNESAINTLRVLTE